MTDLDPIKEVTCLSIAQIFYIYTHAHFQKWCNLKKYMKYIQLLFPHQKTLFDQKTKDIYLIYIFNIAMFLKTGIYIYFTFSKISISTCLGCLGLANK